MEQTTDLVVYGTQGEINIGERNIYGDTLSLIKKYELKVDLTLKESAD